MSKKFLLVVGLLALSGCGESLEHQAVNALKASGKLLGTGDPSVDHLRKSGSGKTICGTFKGPIETKEKRFQLTTGVGLHIDNLYSGQFQPSNDYYDPECDERKPNGQDL
ncbi:hypothetical protein [Pseudomonas mandelii]|uniref:hypothetical protein n=1 Tax=Pseudomonas mandelii TaxID=75612 RepID=UPI003C758573